MSSRPLKLLLYHVRGYEAFKQPCASVILLYRSPWTFRRSDAYPLRLKIPNGFHMH